MSNEDKAIEYAEGMMGGKYDYFTEHADKMLFNTIKKAYLAGATNKNVVVPPTMSTPLPQAVTDSIENPREWLDRIGHEAQYNTSRQDLMSQYATHCLTIAQSHYDPEIERMVGLLKESVQYGYDLITDKEMPFEHYWLTYCEQNKIILTDKKEGE